jgi:hypothetical protein
MFFQRLSPASLVSVCFSRSNHRKLTDWILTMKTADAIALQAQIWENKVMNDTKPFTKQTIVSAVLIVAFIGAVWLTTPPQKNTLNRLVKNAELSTGSLSPPKISIPHQH